ncbi:MAG: hypothetical protein GX142_04505 [Chloroflexi bacterium]|nr:hypothetical protein [Chloroflexota bacterium]
MEEIAQQVFIEQCFSGVVTGALKLHRGLIIIDSPCRPDEWKAWQKKLIHLGSGAAQLMILLDTHPDRLLNMPPIEAPILVQENALEIFHNLPIATRPLEKPSTLEPEPDDMPQQTRWSLPDLCYTQQISLYWDDEPVVVTHQPGAHLAGSWVRYETEKVIFIGDSVVVNQPPFLAWCSIDRWIEELTWLGSDFFKHHKIISGRDGVISQRSINNMVKFLFHLKEVVSELLLMDDPDKDIVQELPGLLKYFHFERELKEQYQKRLSEELHLLLKRLKTDRMQGESHADE